MWSGCSSARARKSMPDCLIIRASSRVVRETSTSQKPEECISLERMISNFLAVQGMTETT